MPHGTTGQGDKQARMRRAWPPLELTALGFFLFDVGYHFARPVPTGLSPVQDVTLLAGQVVATLAVLLAVRATVRTHEPGGARRGASATSQDAGGDHDKAAPLPRRIAAKGLTLLSALGAAACLLAELAIFGAPAGDTGLFPAYAATTLSGLGFGACFATWTLLFCRAGDAPRNPDASPKRACLALLAALAASRAVDTPVRQTLPADSWIVVGMAALDVSLALLVWLCLLGRREGDVAGDTQSSAEPEARSSTLVGLTGATLFSALFGLMTQVHNVSQGITGIPTYVSCIVTLALFVPLAARVALVERPLRLGDLFLASLPLAAGVLIVVALMQKEVLGAADALIKSLFNVYFAATLIWVVRQGCARPTLAPTALLAIWAGVLAGSAAGFAVSSLAGLDTNTVSTLALAAVWLCTLASTLVARSGVGRRQDNATAPAEQAETPGTVGDTGPSPAPAPVRVIDRVDEQAARLADTLGLSPRETQVVALLARGRSAARIAEELVLSESIVKTHLQNAYSKAGVHSKQELLDKMGQQEG